MGRCLSFIAVLLLASAACAQDAPDLEAAHQACARVSSLGRAQSSPRDFPPGFEACAEVENAYRASDRVRQQEADKALINAVRDRLRSQR